MFVVPSGLVPFRIINPTARPIKIFKWTNLGTFFPQASVINRVMSFSDNQQSYCDTIHSTFFNDPSLEFDISPDLTEEQEHEMKNFLTMHVDRFSQGLHDLGRTSYVKHHISTDGTVPIKQRTSLSHRAKTTTADFRAYSINA